MMINYMCFRLLHNIMIEVAKNILPTCAIQLLFVPMFLNTPWLRTTIFVVEQGTLVTMDSAHRRRHQYVDVRSS